MAANELYRSTRTVAIPGRTLPAVDNIDMLGSDLFAEAHIPDYLQGVVKARRGLRKPDSTLRLISISPYHGRSYDIGFDGLNHPVWEDEYGIAYSASSTKGNNFREIHLMKSNTAPSGYALHGLQDTDCLERIITASRILRSVGVETENITRVIIPDQIPYDGKMLTQDELKAAMLEQELARKAAHPTPMLDSLDQFLGVGTPLEARMAKFLQETVFVVTVRAMQVSERLQDLLYVKTPEQARGLMRKALTFVNFTEQLKAEKSPGYEPEYFDPEKDEDIERYLVQYLPRKIGGNLGRMHSAGLVHKFPHNGNISLVGSLYDLDSVEGEPLGLGDTAIDKDKTTKDLAYVAHNFPGVIEAFLRKGFFKTSDGLLDGFQDMPSMNQLFWVASANLLKSYFEQYKGDVDILSLPLPAGAAVNMEPDGNFDLLRKFLRMSGVEYKFGGNSESLVADYLKFFQANIMDRAYKMTSEGPFETTKDFYIALARTAFSPDDEMGVVEFVARTIKKDVEEKIFLNPNEKERGQLRTSEVVGVLRVWFTLSETDRLVNEIMDRYAREITMGTAEVVSSKLNDLLERGFAQENGNLTTAIGNDKIL
jgi:hypothetical protein